MIGYSQIANIYARGEFRKTGNDHSGVYPQTAIMKDDTDKNGGPNHLRAWMRFRGIRGNALAEALGGNVTPGMVSDLANSKRALSAKWLRRLAPILNTSPGFLLDHDPYDLPRDLLEIWNSADERQKKQITDIAHTIVHTGTDK